MRTFRTNKRLVLFVAISFLLSVFSTLVNADFSLQKDTDKTGIEVREHCSDHEMMPSMDEGPDQEEQPQADSANQFKSDCCGESCLCPASGCYSQLTSEWITTSIRFSATELSFHKPTLYTNPFFIPFNPPPIA